MLTVIIKMGKYNDTYFTYILTTERIVNELKSDLETDSDNDDFDIDSDISNEETSTNVISSKGIG